MPQPTEPKSCPFVKGEDGYCRYHRVMLTTGLKDLIAIQHWKLLGVVLGKHRGNIHGGKSVRGIHA